MDRNGINIEFTVEKKTGRKMRTYDRAEFLELCSETIEEYTKAMRILQRESGYLATMRTNISQMPPTTGQYRRSIFVELFKSGDIVEDSGPIFTIQLKVPR